MMWHRGRQPSFGGCSPQGQLEINALFRIPNGSGRVKSVPEVEGTVLDGWSFEFARDPFLQEALVRAIYAF